MLPTGLKVKDKHLYKVLIFDINDFYHSISEKTLNNAINFAEQHLIINTEQKTLQENLHFLTTRQGNVD